jgi:site-specific DNA recombinase
VNYLTTNNSRRALIYTRVSTTEQGENTSLESQFAACLARLHSEGAQLVQHFSDMQSGADYQSRRGLQNALDEIEAKNADIIIVYDMSRLSRDLEHQQAIRKRIERAGGRLLFCTQQFDATPEGSLMFGVTGSFAEYERLKIRERTTRGRRARAEAGRQPCSAMPPFGYNIVTKEQIMRGDYTIEQLGTYQEIEAQSKWIKPLFQKFVAGEAYYALAAWLTAEKIATPRGAEAWSPTTIRNIITNPVYKGAPQFGAHKRLHDEARLLRGVGKSYLVKTDAEARLQLSAPALVSEELFGAAQERVAEIAGGRRAFKERRYLLSGLLRCAACGCGMIGRFQGGNSFYAAKKQKTAQELAQQVADGSIKPSAVYKCRSKWEKSQTPCNGASYNIEATDAALIAQIVEMMGSARQLEVAVRRQLQEAVPPRRPNKKQLPSLRKQLSELERFQDATAQAQIRAIASGDDAAPFERKMHEYSKRKRQLEAEIAAIEANQKSLSKTTVATQARSLQTAMNELSTFIMDESLPVAERFESLSLLIECIVPQNAKTVIKNQASDNPKEDSAKPKRGKPGRPAAIIVPEFFEIKWRLRRVMEAEK